MTEIEFKIGQEHENMKGAYKVLEVGKDAIRICWETGEEISTTAPLQNRIIERMDRERMLIKAKKNKKGKRTKLPELVRKFDGLKKNDFTEDVSGATWRYYDGLGGAVAVRLKSDTVDITSWPRYGLSEVHWADLSHRHHSDFRLQAKFLARLDKKRLYVGLDIGRSNEEKDVNDDWNAFIAWLRDAENETLLHKLVSEQDLSIYDNEEEAFAGIITSKKGKWRLSGKGKKQEIESLADFLDGLTESSWVDLQIARIVEKNKVLPRGVEIADDIAKLFELLMPLYEASAVVR
ncbi:MAG: hypothetical protein JRJ47_04370 [Deltaproteobacteria bacterium]|nr:hypothetical protein [Deltaproteobacteria bacterium]